MQTATTVLQSTLQQAKDELKEKDTRCTELQQQLTQVLAVVMTTLSLYWFVVAASRAEVSREWRGIATRSDSNY